MLATTEEYDENVVLEELKKFCATFPTKGEAADALGVSRVFLWRVLEGHNPPPDSVLKHIGFKRERKITYTYRKVA